MINTRWRSEGLNASILRALQQSPELLALIEQAFQNNVNISPLWWIIDTEDILVRDRGQYNIHSRIKIDGTIRLGDNAELRVI